MPQLCKKISALSLLVVTLVLPLSTVVKAEVVTDKNAQDSADKTTWSVNAPQGKFLDANIKVADSGSFEITEKE